MIPALSLVRIQQTSTVVSAGWLASPDPMDWLREVARGRASGCELALYPVAISAGDPRAAGVLLLPRAGKPNFHPRVQPLAEVLPGVHAPQDAALSAGLLVNERDYLFPYRVHLFHPTVGLVGFDPGDELAPARLLERPAERGLRWNLAMAVEKFAPVLRAILVEEPPEPEAMLDEAAKEIGDQRGKAPDGTDGLFDKAGMIGKGLAGGALLGTGWVLGAFGRAAEIIGGPGQAPGRGSGSIEKLREWAMKNWEQLMDRRSREIERLMKLMDRDPDLGLRYALPLAGIEQSRGVATPTWRLGMKDARFSHGHGGGALDGWDIANEARLKLERQYRSAAKREIDLGRLDRAAYILGNLLGDWVGAAKALSEAGRHRDAVSIYLHKLNNHAAAAACLEQAGLLLQAAASYAKCQQFEKAGDLHARLGNKEQAWEFWRAEVQAQRDALEKARILAEKLEDRSAALDLLDGAWRSGYRPEAALSAMFSLHRRAGESEQALRLLDRMFAHRAGTLKLVAKLGIGHEEVALWSDSVIHRVFENHAYRGIGEALANRDGDSSALLAFLPKLDPADLLLQRDARRFSIRKNPPKVMPSGPLRGNLRPEQVIAVSPGKQWQSLATLPKGVSIAGYGGNMLAVAQFREDRCQSSALRFADDPCPTRVRHFAVSSSRGSARMFHFPDYKRLHYRALDRGRSSNDDAIGHLRQILAAGPFGSNGEFCLLEYTRTSSLTLHVYSEAAVLLRSFPIDLAPQEVLAMDWHLAGHGQHVCLTAHGFLAWRHPDGQYTTINLGESPRSLNLCPAAESRAALITLSTEVLLLEIGKPGKLSETINLYSGPVGNPVACYLPDQSIVIAHEGGGVVYSPDDYVKGCTTLFLPPDAGIPIDVVPRGGGGFAILTDKGNLLVFGR